ncbi:hypothetical protein BH10ACI3_BH10ACI3_16050 [soil metagenome]
MKKFIISTVFVLGLMVIGAGSMAAQTAKVAGDWDATMNTPGGPVPVGLVIKVDGEKLTGTAKRSKGDVAIVGTIKGDDISFSYTIDYNGNPVTITFSGKVKGDTMGGSVYFNDNEGDAWSATRTSASKPKAE